MNKFTHWQNSQVGNMANREKCNIEPANYRALNSGGTASSQDVVSVSHYEHGDKGQNAFNMVDNLDLYINPDDDDLDEDQAIGIPVDAGTPKGQKTMSGQINKGENVHVLKLSLPPPIHDEKQDGLRKSRPGSTRPGKKDIDPGNESTDR